MSIYLRKPAHDPKGPDGQGHNRMEIQGITHDQCALRPTSYATLWEGQDTRRARWGNFGWCVQEGNCGTCPVFTAPRESLDAFTDKVLVRISERDGKPWLMNHPDRGWASSGYPWTWERLARLDGWTVGRSHRDADGVGFWLVRAADPRSVLDEPAVAYDDEDPNAPRGGG